MYIKHLGDRNIAYLFPIKGQGGQEVWTMIRKDVFFKRLYDCDYFQMFGRRSSFLLILSKRDTGMLWTLSWLHESGYFEPCNGCSTFGVLIGFLAFWWKLFIWQDLNDKKKKLLVTTECKHDEHFTKQLREKVQIRMDKNSTERK